MNIQELLVLSTPTLAQVAELVRLADDTEFEAEAEAIARKYLEKRNASYVVSVLFEHG